MPTKVPIPRPIAISFQQLRYSRNVSPSLPTVRMSFRAAPNSFGFRLSLISSTAFSIMAPMAKMPMTRGIR